MLYTASFYDREHWQGQCYRVSRAHPRGRSAEWDTARSLYPPRELLQAYRSGQLNFAGLSTEYLKELDASYQQDAQFQEWVDGLPTVGDLTLLCFERGDMPCHRRVAAQWLLDKAPGLVGGKLR